MAATATQIRDRVGGWRARFRTWRHHRPFWGGTFAVLAGLQVFISTQLTLGHIQVRVGVEGLQSIVIPIVLVLAGVLIWFMPAHRVFYGVITLVVAVYSLIGVNLGGFLIGMLFGILGGALAIAWAPRDDDPGAVAAGDGRTDLEDQDETVGVDALLDRDGPLDDADGVVEHPDDDADDESDLDDPHDPPRVHEPEATARHRSARRFGRRGSGVSMRQALAAGVGSVAIAVGALALPAVAGSQASAVPALDLPTLFPWPPDPSDDPTPTPTDSPTDTGSPSPTGIPRPTDAPTSDPNPTGDPDDPDDPGTDDPEQPGVPERSPTPTPSPTESPVIEVPPGESPAEPRAIKTPENLAGQYPGHLTGSRLTMTGLSYDGVVDVPTADGSIPSLQFSMDRSVVDDFSLLVPSSDGNDLLTLADELTVEGNVKFYTNRFSGKLLGVPLTFTPDFPPPLVLPTMTFGDPDINLVYIASDSLTAENNRQYFP